MRHTLWPLLAAALLFAGAAQAQVAAPELVPAAPRFFKPGQQSFNGATVTPDNPAALQWSTASLFAFGLFDLKSETPAPTSDKYRGWFAGYRGVSDAWAFGLEHSRVDHTSGPYGESATSAHVSFQVLEGLAVGAGHDRSQQDTGAVTQKESENTLGFSVNLAKQFYLGYAMGRDKYDDGTNTGDRDTTMYGIAFRTEGNWRWHLAYDVLDKAGYTNGVGNGLDASTITAQVGVGNWVLGAQLVDHTTKGAGTDFSATVVDVGWAPEKAGLSVTARLWDGGNSGGSTSTDRGTAVNIGYTF